MDNQQDQFGATTPDNSDRSTQNPAGGPAANSRKASPASAAPTAKATDSPSQPTASAEPQGESHQADTSNATEGTLLDAALNSGKKWIEDSGVLGNVNQLPQGIKDLGNRALSRVNELSTTQKVVGGAILAVGLGWLATRKGKSSSEESSPYNYGRQRDTGNYGRRSYGYQAPDASTTNRRTDSGAPYGNSGRFGSSASATTDHGSQASSHSAGASSAGSGFGTSSDE